MSHCSDTTLKCLYSLAPVYLPTCAFSCCLLVCVCPFLHFHDRMRACHGLSRKVLCFSLGFPPTSPCQPCSWTNHHLCDLLPGFQKHDSWWCERNSKEASLQSEKQKTNWGSLILLFTEYGAAVIHYHHRLEENKMLTKRWDAFLPYLGFHGADSSKIFF